MDPLTDLLNTVRVGGVCHARLEATAPWGAALRAGNFAGFGLITEGDAWLAEPGAAEGVALAAGDFYLLGPGRAVVLQDAPGERVLATPDAACLNHGPRLVIGGGSGGGARATILGGRFHFDESTGRLLGQILPPVLILRAAAREATLATALDLLAAEAVQSAPGTPLITQRLADIVLIQALRAHMAAPGRPEAGWLRAVIDPAIGASLRAIHERLSEPWTVADLALAAGMSRSAFAPRFKELTGATPLDYLTRWRMYRASHLLRETDRKLADVAQAVGYDSDAAFIKAFKRVLGLAPGEYRRMAA